MEKKYYIKSRVSGKVRKTKHIVFCSTDTNCYRFSFKINRNKNGKLNIVNVDGLHVSINPTSFKNEIRDWKKDCDRRFGRVGKRL